MEDLNKIIDDRVKNGIDEKIATLQTECQNNMNLIKADVEKLKAKTNNFSGKSYGTFTIPKALSQTQRGEKIIDTITMEKDCKMLISTWANINTYTNLQIGMQVRIFRGENSIAQVYNGNTFTRGGGITTSRVYSMKKGDKVEIRMWNWDTTQEIKISDSHIIMQEV